MSRDNLATGLMGVGVLGLAVGLALFYVTPLAAVAARLAGDHEQAGVRVVAIVLTLAGLAAVLLGSSLEPGRAARPGPGVAETPREAEMRRALGDDGDPGDDLDLDLD